MNARLHLLLILGSGMLLIGCALARSSYHVVTAPVRLFTGGSEQPTQPPVTTTTTTTVAANSDVVAPGRAVASPTPAHVRRRVQETSIAGESPSPSSATNKRQEAKAKTGPSPHASPGAVEFPTAKAVPGKPGYVFDPFDANGGYIDVSGYAPGSKVKDPATKKIFIVP